MIAAMVFITQLTGSAAYAFLDNSTVGKGSVKCGDGHGNTCGNNFNNAYCDSTEGVKGSDPKGACCHDDFNVWCCPEGYRCSGSFNDPGGNTHCMTADKHSNSCVCDDDPKVVKVEGYGTPTVQSADQVAHDDCCFFGQDPCQFSVTGKYKDSVEISWQTTTQFGASVTVAEGAIFEKVEFTFEFSQSWTNGKKVDQSHEIDLNTGCGCSKDVCKADYNHVVYQLSLKKQTQPVRIIMESCGKQVSTTGSIALTTYTSSGACAHYACANYDQCMHDKGIPSAQSQWQCKGPQ